MTDPANCPACARKLRPVVHQDVHVDVCDCGSMWFDAGEIETWTQGAKPMTSWVAANPPVHGEKKVCPGCRGSGLIPLAANGVEFSRCADCAGIWLPSQAVAALDPSYPKEDWDSSTFTMVAEFLAQVVGSL